MKDNFIQDVLLGDCLTLMEDIPNNSVDMVLCDLPYGTTGNKWDKQIPLDKLWCLYDRICKSSCPILLFAQTPFDKVLGCSNLSNLRYKWIWEKTRSTGFFNAYKMPMKAHENILVFYKELPFYNPQKTQNHKPINTYTKKVEVHNKLETYGKVSIPISGGGNTDRFPRSVQVFSPDNKRVHPTQKPIELCEYFIKTYSKPGDLILDNCAGSGSTLIAAKKLERQFIGIEIEEKYYQICLERLKFY